MNKEVISKIAIYTVLIVGAVSMILPFFWMVSTSLKTPMESLRFPPTWIPSHFVWSNYKEVFDKVPFVKYFINTFFMAIATLLGVLFTSILAGYAFATMNFKGKDAIFMGLLAVMMVPMPVYIVPGYLILQYLGWIDTFYALIVPWLANVFSIFLLRQHFKTLPKELYESAMIDGAGEFYYLWKIAVPLIKPAIVTMSLFSVIGSWNSFIWPLVVTNRDAIRPVQVGLAYFVQEQSTDYTLLMAATTIVVLPLIILFFLGQRQIIESFSRSGMKG